MHIIDFEMELYFGTIKMLGEFRNYHKIGFSLGRRDASIIAMMQK